MSLEKIQQAVISKLVADFPLWTSRIAWENVTFTPPAAQPWMAFNFMPVEERIATLGAGGRDQTEGLAQITVAYPLNVGESDLRETINALRTCFKPAILQHEGTSVSILARYRSGGAVRDGFFKVPFTIRWRAQLTR